jgi:hydroxyacylglutathione hydrolase
MPAQTRLFLCLKDNYGVLLHDAETGATAAIDAPEAAPIEAALKATGWRLSDSALKARVLETPGHTAGHISYVFPADKLAFVGDTLFSIGCGRVIEGNPEMMWQSLLKLRALPDDMKVFCGHEYTKANIRFAKTVEPDNAALKSREQQVERLLAAHEPTVPSLLGEEKVANPFLRADAPEVAKSVGLAGQPAWKVFAEIRERKNRS